MIPHSKPLISPKDIESVSRQMATGMLANGQITAAFERKLLGWTGGAAAIATISGTAAQMLALRALGIGPGDEVVIPTYVCESVGRAIVWTGATPVFCDSGETWNATRDTIKKRVTPRTKAVILVNIFGIEIDAFDLGVPIIEDHCQSFGLSKLRSKIGFYSFHATKCLTTGEGGAVVFADAALAESIRPFAAALSDMQAALGISQLDSYEMMQSRRSRIALRYFKELPAEFTAPLNPLRSVYFRFPLTMHGRFEKLQSQFAEHGVAVRRGVEELRHRAFGQPDNDYFGAVRAYSNTVSIPIYPAMSDVEVDQVVRAVNAIA